MLGGAVDDLCGIIRCPHPGCTSFRRQLGQSFCGAISIQLKMQMLPKVCEHGSVYAISVDPSWRTVPMTSLHISQTSGTALISFGAEKKFHIMMFFQQLTMYEVPL
jgi:hypothetical protein